jgi:gliding motility-associated-like protein
VTVTDTNGCTGTSPAVNVSVDPVPNANFTFTPSPTSYIGNETVFTDLSTVSSGNIVSWVWDFGDGGNSNLENPTYYYTSEGIFTIELTVTTQAGCVDTITQTVKVESGYTFYVPNAFTPNNDGLNDEFMPKFSAIDPASFEMYIFDRWGMKIYHTKDINAPWLGKVNNSGDTVEEDVYEYIFKFKDLGGKGHTVTGHISVIR